MKPIASRKVFAFDMKTGQTREVTFEVHAPRSADDGKNYFCLARIVGIEDEEHDTGGVDSIQALLLAVFRLQQRFDELKKVFAFRWPDKDTAMDSLDFLPGELRGR